MTVSRNDLYSPNLPGPSSIPGGVGEAESREFLGGAMART
jgi:hypothetical protein